MVDNLNTEAHRDTIDKLGDRDQPKSVHEQKLEDFFGCYHNFLCDSIARKLRRRVDDLDVVSCVQGFFTEQIEKILKGKANVWNRWDRRRSFRKWLASCCWKSALKQWGVPLGTPDAYESFREDLIDRVQERITRPGVPDDLVVNVPDYVREFLEYHSSRHPRPPKDPYKQRARLRQDDAARTSWWEDFQEKCLRYVEWWLVRTDFPAWDYLPYRERLLAELRDRVEPDKLPAQPPLELLVDAFLKLYGAQNLRVRQTRARSTTVLPLPKSMIDECVKYVLNGENWREKYAAKRHMGVEAVRKERPRRRGTEVDGLDVDQLGKGSARRDDRADNGQPILYHQPGDHRMDGRPEESQTPEDRRFLNELAKDVIKRHLRERRGTPHARLLQARALEPFAANLSAAPPYEAIYARCGFPGATEAAKLRAAELAWTDVQKQIKATLRSELNSRWPDAPRMKSREEWVEDQVGEFYRFLETVAKHFDLSENAHQASAGDRLRPMLRQELNDRWPEFPRPLNREPWVEQKLGEFYQSVDNLVSYFDTAKNASDSTAQDDLGAALRGELYDVCPEFPPTLPSERWGEREIAEFYRFLSDVVKYFDRPKKANDPAADDDFQASHDAVVNGHWPDDPLAMPSRASVEQQVRDLHRFLGAVVRHFPLSQNTYDCSAQDDFRSLVRGWLHPEWSTTTTEQPDLSKCSLGLIAVLLMEPGVLRTMEDRRREWDECLRRPVRELLNGRLAEAPRDEDDGEPGAEDTPEQANTPDADTWEDRTFGDWIHYRQPSIEALKRVKETFRTCSRQAGHDQHFETLIAAYLASIAAALVSTGERITRKKDPELADDLRWLAEEEWIDSETRKLAEQARQRLKKRGKKKG